MPIPTPVPKESQADYMQRCMSDANMVKDYKQKQRSDICMNTFARLSKKPA
jgi:hypothetical protein